MCSFTSDLNDDVPENFIKVVSNATFVYVDDQQGQAHQNVNSSGGVTVSPPLSGRLATM